MLFEQELSPEESPNCDIEEPRKAKMDPLFLSRMCLKASVSISNVVSDLNTD